MFKPNYQITPFILNAISEIAAIKVAIEKSRVLPLNEAQLRRQAIVRMAHTSTSIEGNRLAEYQVDKVLSGMSVNADDKSILEVKNYQEAIKKMEEIASEKKPLTIEMVLSIHAILIKGLLPKEKTGHFRPGDIYIVDDLGDGREKLRFTGPPPKKLAYLVNELLSWLHQSDVEALHPIIKAGLFHTQFVHIHPFSDGNGRITRLLTQLILYRDGWDFRKIIVLEDFYNRDRQAYYNALAEGWGETYKEGNDLTPWLEYFLKGFLVEARKVDDIITPLGFGSSSNTDQSIFVDHDEVKIMDFLSTTGQVTSNDVIEILGVAKRTAQLKLKNLTDKGLTEPKGKGPSTYYVLKN